MKRSAVQFCSPAPTENGLTVRLQPFFCCLFRFYTVIVRHTVRIHRKNQILFANLMFHCVFSFYFLISNIHYLPPFVNTKRKFPRCFNSKKRNGKLPFRSIFKIRNNCVHCYSIRPQQYFPKPRYRSDIRRPQPIFRLGYRIYA